MKLQRYILIEKKVKQKTQIFIKYNNIGLDPINYSF